MIRTSHWRRAVLLLGLSLLTFLPFLGRRDVVTSHEARVIQTARQMAESGWPWNAQRVAVAKPDGKGINVNPWVIPVMNGQIRLQKPPLPYWVAATLYRLVDVSEAVSRFVPAMLGALSVLLVWDVARRLIGRVGAWYAALVWVSTFFIVDEFRKSMADPYLAFFTLACTWAWIRSVTVRSLLTFYVMLGLGLLAKGPLILVFLAVILPAYHVFYHRPIPRGAAAHLAGAAIALAMCMVWAIPVAGSIPSVIEQWRFESAGAFSDKTQNARPFWFYLPNLLLITLPWTPLWLIGLWLAVRRRPQQRRFALVVIAIVVLIFSLAYAKKNAYLLPLMPIMAIAVAEGLRWLDASFHARRLRGIITMAAVLFSVLTQVALMVVSAQDNARSPRPACQLALRLLGESPKCGLLVSELPEEATVYLPLNPSSPSTADTVLAILDNRKRDAEARARQITSTPSGPVKSIERISDPAERFQVFRLMILPVQSPPPRAG